MKNNNLPSAAVTNDISDFFHSIDLFKSAGEIENVINQSNVPDVTLDDMSFFKVTSLTFDKDYPQREAFENVIASVTNPAFNLVYILSGTKTGVELYLGAVRNGICDTQIHASEYSNHIKKTFLGNFSGSIAENNLDKDGIQSCILDVNRRLKRSGVILGIPSYNASKDKSEDFQGIDRLINSMQGSEWRIVIVCRPLDKESINRIKNDVYEIYNRLYLFSKVNIQQNQSITDTNSSSDTTGSSKTKQDGYGTNSPRRTSNHNVSEGTNNSHQESSSIAFNQGASMSFELANKKAQESLKYIDEELLERIKVGAGKGIFSTAVYYMAKDTLTRDQLKSALLSLYQGEKSSFSPLRARDFSSTETANEVISSFRTHFVPYNEDKNVPSLLGSECFDRKIELSTLLIPKEIGLFAGLPQHEVPGITLKQAVEFGLNVKSNDDDSIEIGSVIQRGNIIKQNSFMLPKKNFCKHIFIGGVTGSGKTVTCQKLVCEAKIPFLVLEPAKTEYRSMVKNGIADDVVVFTMGNESCAPFRFNPFELIHGENISSHIDMLRATFTSAFPMEASMPQLLDEAIVACYEKMGWDIGTNSNRYSDDPYNGEYFPTMSELLYMLPQIVKKKHFGDRLQSEYIGSLVSRISNLTVGAKGYMLDCRKSVDFEKLIEHNVIIEMEDMKSPEDKALMMGFILSRLACVIRKRHQENPSFRHITLVEEAHRLLSKSELGDSGAKKSSVEMFTDLLAEVRKYGEGLVIVDQIPNKLSVEVLKNTNTKIIHKLFAKDDKETVGNTMLMDEEQQSFLSSLDTGEAIIFTESTPKPMHVKISNSTSRGIINTDSDDISNDEVKECCEDIRRDMMPKCIDRNMLQKFRELLERSQNNEALQNNETLQNDCLDKIRQLVSNADSPKHTFITLYSAVLTANGYIIENMNETQSNYSEITKSFDDLVNGDYAAFTNKKIYKMSKMKN
ncbi:MAG: ATP-binding protein [Oscillospiraceae bacterium]